MTRVIQFFIAIFNIMNSQLNHCCTGALWYGGSRGHLRPPDTANTNDLCLVHNSLYMNRLVTLLGMKLAAVSLTQFCLGTQH